MVLAMLVLIVPDVVLAMVLTDDVLALLLTVIEVDDDRATRTQTGNHNGHGNRKTTIKHSIGCRSGKRTRDRYYHGHDSVNYYRAKSREQSRLEIPVTMIVAWEVKRNQCCR